MEGEGRSELSVDRLDDTVRQRKNRQLWLGIEHLKCASDLRLPINGIPIGNPNVATAATFDDGNTSAPLVLMGPGASDGGRRGTSKFGHGLSSGLEKAGGNEESPVEENTNSQQQGGKGDGEDHQNGGGGGSDAGKVD